MRKLGLSLRSPNVYATIAKRRRIHWSSHRKFIVGYFQGKMPKIIIYLFNLDVRTAFLYGEMKKEVFLEVPEGLNYDPIKNAVTEAGNLQSESFVENMVRKTD